MKKISKGFKRTFKHFKNNLLFVGLVLSAVINDFILRVLTVGNVFKVKPIITSIAIILIISISIILLSNKKRNYMYILFSGIFALLNVFNYMYYTHFNSFISINIFKQAKHLSEMKNSIRQTLDIKVLLFIIPTLLLMYLYRKLKENDYFENIEEFSIRKEIITPFVLGLALLLVVSITLTSTDISRFKKQWNREYLVEQFGIYSYATADLVKAASVPKVIESDFEDFDAEIRALVKENEELDMENKYTDTLEGKDLYVIHYESVQNFAMDLAFDHGEVTPFLNQLADESLFFNNFYPQHSVGTSSDTEFTFSTSLHPINNRTVFIDHADKEFNTIQKLLVDKGYYTMSMHGNNGSFWNRNIMHPNIGYEEFVSKEEYEIDEEVGLGLSDESFYKQSVEKIKQRKGENEGPLMVTLISLSNHYPFDELEVYGDFDTGYLEGTNISNYLKSMNYADRALESFFIQMEEEGLLDNAAVIIYGDHHAKISKDDYELLYNYDEETETITDKLDDNYIEINRAYLKQVRKTPFLIWTKDDSFQEKVEEPIGMIDVMPTLANMLNINNPYSLGRDIFNVEDNTVVFPDGSFLTKNYYYSSSALKVYDMKTNELLSSEKEFSKEFLEKVELVEKTLELSSNLIENNLIKCYEDNIKEDNLKKRNERVMEYCEE